MVYAVQMSDGHYVGVWQRRQNAEVICAKSPGGRGDRVVEMVPAEALTAECAWYQDGEEGPWATGCGHYFSIIDGTPTENDFRYCCFCGAALREIPP